LPRHRHGGSALDGLSLRNDNPRIVSEASDQFFHQRHRGHDSSPGNESVRRTFQFPIEIRAANDPKIMPRGKRIFRTSAGIVAVMLLASLIAAFPFALGWDENPIRRDHGALNLAFVIEAAGVLLAIWVATRKKSPVLTITRDGLTRHRRRMGALGSGTRTSEVFIRWNDIAALEARQEVHSNLLLGMPTGKSVIPLKSIWFFLRDSRSAPVICEVLELDRKPAEIFQIVDACFKTFGGKPAATPDAVQKDPVEIRYGLRSAGVSLVLAVFNGWLGGGMVWVGMFSARGLWQNFSDLDFTSLGEVVFGLILSLACIYSLYHAGRGFSIRSPQLIIGADHLTCHRSALSVPWREIDPGQLQFNVSRTSNTGVSFINAATIRIAFHGAGDARNFARSPVILNLSRMNRSPEAIYYLIKARALAAKK
jgi:hypothetical protein